MEEALLEKIKKHLCVASGLIALFAPIAWGAVYFIYQHNSKPLTYPLCLLQTFLIAFGDGALIYAIILLEVAGIIKKDIIEEGVPHAIE